MILFWLLFILGLYVVIVSIYGIFVFVWFFVKEKLLEYDEKEKEFIFYDE